MKTTPRPASDSSSASRRPRERSSTSVTAWPSSSSRAARWAPMKPAPPSSSALAIADARVADARVAHHVLVEEAPAVVDERGPPQRAEQARQVQLRVLRVGGDHEHGVGAGERLPD